MCIRDSIYSPPIGALFEPIAIAAQVVHRGEAQVQLGLLAQALLRPRHPARHPAHAGTAAFAGAAPGFSVAAFLRSSARPFCAAIAIGSNSAPIGGE